MLRGPYVMPRLVLALAASATLLSLVPSGAAPAADGRAVPTRGDAYLGAERCGSCHEAAYRKWKTSPHARGLQSLPPDRRADTKCTGCHSPDPGGLFAGVQCESCHGAGRHYAFDFVMK